MKKIAVLLLMLSAIMLTGCEKVSDLVKPAGTEEVVSDIGSELGRDEDGELEEPKTKIVLSKVLNMTNDWTIMGDYSLTLTRNGKKDRVILGTSAIAENGEMQWDDSQYWTLAVLTDDGAYNLFHQRMQGRVYAEVNEAFIKGIATPVITVYAFSGTERDIRNYVYDPIEDVFVEDQVFTTKKFSTGGINNFYSTFPEYKPR